MHISLNELMLTCQKAARGTGIAEGAAEDLRKAALWLALHGFPAVDSVYDALVAVESGVSAYGEFTLSDDAIDWHPGCGAEGLSAASIGGAAADLFTLFLPNEDGTACLRSVDVPLLQLAQFAANMPATARILIRWFDQNSRIDFRLTAGELGLIACKGAAYASGRFQFEVSQHTCGNVTVDDNFTVVAEDENMSLRGLDVDEVIWEKLKAFADLTLVEPTARSRALGAGAGLDDND